MSNLTWLYRRRGASGLVALSLIMAGAVTPAVAAAPSTPAAAPSPAMAADTAGAIDDSALPPTVVTIVGDPNKIGRNGKSDAQLAQDALTTGRWQGEARFGLSIPDSQAMIIGRMRMQDSISALMAARTAARAKVIADWQTAVAAWRANPVGPAPSLPPDAATSNIPTRAEQMAAAFDTPDQAAAWDALDKAARTGAIVQADALYDKVGPVSWYVKPGTTVANAVLHQNSLGYTGGYGQRGSTDAQGGYTMTLIRPDISVDPILVPPAGR